MELSSLYCLNIHTVTCDGIATNFDAMRNLGCTFGTKLDEMDGSFSCDFFDHKLFFVADACHMLKLARNALADVKVFVQYEGRQNALEYIMFAGHPDFANADGTIDSIRTLDRLFDLMNARSLHDLMNATKDRFFSMT
eukprot:gene9869-18457_t